MCLKRSGATTPAQLQTQGSDERRGEVSTPTTRWHTTLRGGGARTRMGMPVLSVSAAKDTIAPPDGVDAITQIVPHAEVVRLPGGHVGIVAGRSAITLWDITSKFLRVAMTRSGS